MKLWANVACRVVNDVQSNPPEAPGLNIIYVTDQPCPDNPLLWGVKATGINKNLPDMEPGTACTAGSVADILDCVVHIPAMVMRRVATGVEGKVLIMADARVMHFINPHRLVNVLTPNDMIWGLYHHVGFTSIPSIISMVRRLWKGVNVDPTNIADFMVNEAHIRWSANPNCTLFRMPRVDMMVYTNGNGIIVQIFPSRLPIATLGTPVDGRPNDIYGMSMWDAALRVLQHVSNMLAKWAPFVATCASLATLFTRSSRQMEAKGKTKHGRGRAVRDSDYEEYRDAKRDWRKDMSLQEFMALRDRANAGAQDADAQRYRAWIALRELRMSNNAYRHEVVDVIGKSGHRVEVRRLDMMRAPRNNNGYEDYDDDGDYAAEGVSHLLPMLAGDERIGWAVHVGGGRLMTCTHLVKSGASPPCRVKQTTSTNDLTILETDYHGPAKQLATALEPASS